MTTNNVRPLQKAFIQVFVTIGWIFGKVPGTFKILDIGLKALSLNNGYLIARRWGTLFAIDMEDYTHRKVLLYCFERSDIGFLIRLVSNDKKIVDIGANVGFVSIPCAKACLSGEVIAIEPVPNTYLQLKANIDLNTLTNISSRNVAIGTRDGELILDNTVETDDSSGFWRKVDTLSSTSITVPAISLDQVMQECGRIDLLKIDAEGMELEILRGGGDLLNPSNVKNLMVELTYDKTGINKESAEVVHLLKSKGYVMYRVSVFGKLIKIDPKKYSIKNNVLNIFAM